MSFLKTIRKNIVRVASYTLILLFTLFLGYSIGTFQHKNSARIGYKLGLTPFCELEEIDRFKVCPLMRVYKDLATGGSITVYICSAESAFVETSSLTKESVKFLKSTLEKVRKNGGVIKDTCSTDRGIVYEIVGFTK